MTTWIREYPRTVFWIVLTIALLAMTIVTEALG